MALLRVCAGLVILADLAIRATDLAAHYSDTGVLPRLAHYELFYSGYLSLHLLSGSPYVMGFLFLIAAVCAVLMGIGYRTRLFTILSWVMLVSLQNRNPMILQGGDDLLRMVLFWAMFIPWGSYFSVDSLTATRKPSSYSVFSPGVVALMVQVGVLYLSTFMQKSGVEWRSEFTAVYYALNVDQMALAPALWFRQYPLLMKASTAIVIVLEGIAPLLLFFPFKTGWVRLVAVPLLIGMHITFGLFLKIGLFPYIDAIALLVFVPSLFWERAIRTPNLTIPSRSGVPSVKWSPIFYTEAVAVIFLLGSVVFWNVTTLTSKVKGSAVYDSFMFTLRLDQNWGMFSPHPFRDDGWYIIPASDRRGNRFDLLKASTDARVNWVKPKQPSLLFKNYRWRKYFRNIYYVENERHRLYLGKCLCLNWNKNRPYEDQLTTFQMYYVREETPTDPSQLPISENLLLWTHHCFGEEQEDQLPPLAEKIEVPRRAEIDQIDLGVNKTKVE